MIKDKITLIGAGLVGSLLGILLAKRGYAVDIYERRSDIRKTSVDAGRSINLALSPRGIQTLEMVDLDQQVLQSAVQMKGRKMHATSGELSFLPYGKDDHEVLNSVSRAHLNNILLDHLEQHENVRLHFDHKCTELDIRNDRLLVENSATKEKLVIPTGIVIGTDGSASSIRTSMLTVGRFNFSQSFLQHGYKELEIPPDANGNFRMDKDALHIWARGQFMMIALPNNDASFTVTLFLPFDGEYGFNNLSTEEKVASFFNTQFPDAVPLIPNLLQDFFANPTGNLATIRCSPWNMNGKVLLLGDAAHGIVPFYGQGMNAGFEDCRLLIDLLDHHPNNWDKIFSTFSQSRKIDTDAIADLSLDNFIEMRDRVEDNQFLLRKKAELLLYRQYPKDIISKYSMVTFHPEIPYSVALQKGKILEDTLQELCQGMQSVDELDLSIAYQLIISKYRELHD
ncbi:MAG: FAD-dependent oxidoreductase [Candidatus Kariarchaeaceae archaeon]|jgi:kynurenine 3-monooxygenase